MRFNGIRNPWIGQDTVRKVPALQTDVAAPLALCPLQHHGALPNRLPIDPQIDKVVAAVRTNRLGH
jgi:hypothetical protein